MSSVLLSLGLSMFAVAQALTSLIHKEKPPLEIFHCHRSQ